MKKFNQLPENATDPARKGSAVRVQTDPAKPHHRPGGKPAKPLPLRPGGTTVITRTNDVPHHPLAGIGTDQLQPREIEADRLWRKPEKRNGNGPWSVTMKSTSTTGK